MKGRFWNYLRYSYEKIHSNFCFRGDTNDEKIQKLSVGLLNVYQPKLTLVKGQLQELTDKQNVLYNQLHAENLKFAEARQSVDLQDMFRKIKIYREKLVSIKQNMVFLHEQSTKLKKRALKLEQQKQKEALDKVHQRENEEQLIAKPQTS
ncbi:UNVERIFIED_CONTAM: hypothetical protein PYX00_008921 [Menopon gallinae]|uniref:Biogenesis of lysosome-related organelles complex 1 subunit 6 n=1 Tax=Menopon gallinae TaxID=328185 RepID=A0AAW2H9Y0_9NEOP